MFAEICSSRDVNVLPKDEKMLLPLPRKKAESTIIDPVVTNPVMFAFVAYWATLYVVFTSVHTMVPADVPAGYHRNRYSSVLLLVLSMMDDAVGTMF